MSSGSNREGSRQASVLQRSDPPTKMNEPVGSENEPASSILPESEASSATSDVRNMLSVPEAATFIGRTKGWLDKARCYGNGPPFYRIGRRILYRRDELGDWLQRRRHESTSNYHR